MMKTVRISSLITSCSKRTSGEIFDISALETSTFIEQRAKHSEALLIALLGDEDVRSLYFRAGGRTPN